MDLEVHDDHVAIEARVSIEGKTGVEMEALTACSVAALTIYDMCKSIDKAMVISEISLQEKTGEIRSLQTKRLDLAKLKKLQNH